MYNITSKLKHFWNNQTCDIFRNGLQKLFLYTSGNHLHFAIYNARSNATKNNPTSYSFVRKKCVGYHLSFIPTQRCVPQPADCYKCQKSSTPIQFCHVLPQRIVLCVNPDNYCMCSFCYLYIFSMFSEFVFLFSLSNFPMSQLIFFLIGFHIWWDVFMSSHVKIDSICKCFTQKSNSIVVVIINSSPPSAASMYMYIRQWIGSALDEMMACRQFGTKPLSKPMLGYFQWDYQEHI